MAPLLIYLLTINALGFWIMLDDKQRARKKRWRIPEATLLTVALLGGSAGCFLGMRLCRHKTRKPKFSVGLPVILLLQLLLASWLVWSGRK